MVYVLGPNHLFWLVDDLLRLMLDFHIIELFYDIWLLLEIFIYIILYGVGQVICVVPLGILYSMLPVGYSLGRN